MFAAGDLLYICTMHAYVLIRHCAGGGRLVSTAWVIVVSAAELPLFAALVAAGNPSLCCWLGLCSAKLLGSTAGNPFVSLIGRLSCCYIHKVAACKPKLVVLATQ